MIYLIADTHFGDDNIRRYENRPFATAGEMDEALIRNWNSVVKEGDLVYVLGDFALAGGERALLERLAGRKILIKGNHDRASCREYREWGFEEAYDLPVILDGFWILSHEPLYVNENMPYANLFGHVHGSPQYRTCSGRHYCVSAERIGYQPIPLKKVKEEIQKKDKQKSMQND